MALLYLRYGLKIQKKFAYEYSVSKYTPSLNFNHGTYISISLDFPNNTLIINNLEEKINYTDGKRK